MRMTVQPQGRGFVHRISTPLWSFAAELRIIGSWKVFAIAPDSAGGCLHLLGIAFIQSGVHLRYSCRLAERGVDGV
jgi:hypothetical protein